MTSQYVVDEFVDEVTAAGSRSTADAYAQY